MGFSWKKFADIALQVSSIALPMVNPAFVPMVSVIGHAIGEAEAMQGATGQQKLQRVKDIVATVAPNIPGVNAQAISDSLEEGIDTVVAATNVIAAKVPVPVVSPVVPKS